MYLKLAMVEAILILKVEAGTWPRTELTRLSELFSLTGNSPDFWMAGYRHLGHHTITQDAAVFWILGVSSNASSSIIVLKFPQ